MTHNSLYLYTQQLKKAFLSNYKDLNVETFIKMKENIEKEMSETTDEGRLHELYEVLEGVLYAIQTIKDKIYLKQLTQLRRQQ